MMGKSSLKLALLADAAHVNVQRWCEGLRRAGADVHVLSFHAGSSTSDQVYQLPTLRLPNKLYYGVSVPYVRRLIDRIQPHVVVAYYVTGYGTLAALVDRHPTVQVTSGSDVLLAPGSRLMKRLLRYNLSRADMVTAWAPHMALAAQHLGAPSDRMLVLPRGIPFNDFAGARCEAPSRGSSVNIISTRSLKASFNLDAMLAGLRLVVDAGLKVNLTLAGDGPYRKELEAKATALGVDQHVRFAGFVSNDQLPALLGQHDFYLSLVGSDGVSASLLEAMAVGLLPIVPDNDANRVWVTHGLNGLLLKDLSPSSVAQVIVAAIFNPELRERAWSCNAALVSERADLYRNSEIFVEHFRRLATDYTQKGRARVTLTSPVECAGQFRS